MDGFMLQFINGLKTTVLLALASGTLGMALGLLVAAGRLSRFKPISLAAGVYTTVIRGVPELIIILLIYFGGTVAISAVFGRYVEINAFLAGVVSLTVVFGAYAAEIFRGAVLSIPAGQIEAARSLGLHPWQTWMLVILPQMLRIALPALANQWISLVKETSLISIVGLTDIMRVAAIGAGSLRAPLTFYLAASVIYLALTSIALVAFSLLERRFAVPGR
ncbi:ABC transporter permease subunit [Rhizobium leguminosarum]|uniref:ABC transporter permease n=1 Tax=Rhizobium leguminosarum TaxID=384 RepID=UPI00102FD695|nr:ABC transporter permease subunit [Rhizobium leguminosarum]TBF87923.1 ABC transporter permease subunit [Rhizobium leguminosarum]TBG07096.1 ABC transporter permease subunit [Rhizobium leguminosarum]TBG07569.1 ABC transporter permease subunit [Rhizobium leguminosarum]TBG30780.1 ABC transporter permease subunit [Rhizobium leguminosarum]TBG50021.1 ABC transporter permease subunit [Rhizobium leguminosarum]